MDVSDADIRSLIDDKYDGSTENKAAVRQDINRLALGEPLAYVIGWIPFLGVRIYLDSKPLIPRPETEWWTAELIKKLQGLALERKVLDLCAGSGAIGCTMLKHCPGVQVSFGELDPAHEPTIRKNIAECLGFVNPTSDVGFTKPHMLDVRIGDLFEPFNDDKFDIIAANPPYIPAGRVLEKSVTAFELSEALFAGDDGLAIIRRLAQETPKYLNPGGLSRAESRGELWMECDISNIEEARRLVLEGGALDADILTDPYGRPRVIVGHY